MICPIYIGPNFASSTDGPLSRVNCRKQRRKLDSSCRVCQRFNSIAEDSECSDHSRSAGSLSPSTYCGAAFLIANAVVQNDPDQLTEAMSNGMVLLCPRRSTKRR